MLHRHIHHSHFTVFVFFSLFLSLLLGYFVIQEMQTPVVLADENYIPSPHKNVPDTKILLFGDMMLDRGVREQININGQEYPFNLIKDFISGNDLVVANAEGPFTSFDSLTLGKINAPLNFTFDPTILPTIKNLGFTLLGQANNHTLNFGLDGFAQSKASIAEAGLNYFGDPSNKDGISYVEEINGEKIGFVGYNEFSYEGKDNIISTIQQIRNQVSFLIIYAHWGVEYSSDFSKSQQKTAHDFIDAGADVVVGMHPHVIEPIEFYKNKPIFYSIGNFIFDQKQDKTTEGLAIKILLNKEYATYEINPFFINNIQATLMDIKSLQLQLSTLEKNVINPEDFREDITTRTIKVPR